MRAVPATNHTLERQVIELYTLFSISRSFSLPVDLAELVTACESTIRKKLNVDTYCLSLDIKPLLENPIPPLCYKECLFARRDWKRKSFVLIKNAKEKMNFDCPAGIMPESGSMLVLPLRDRHGDVIGTFNIHRPAKGGEFAKDEIEFFKKISIELSISFEKIKLIEELRKKTVTDPLTNLFNKQYLLSALEKEIDRGRRYSRPLSLLMIDIDHFKRVNDTYGHLAGDEVLKVIAKTLLAKTRKSDIVGRFGGEEFAIILPETVKEQGVLVGEKLRVAIEKDCDFLTEKGERIKSAITIGVASFPNDAHDVVTLFKNADNALYEGKKRGRNRVVPC